MVDQPASFHTPIHSAIMKATHLPEIFNTPLQISKTTKYRSKTRVRIIPKQLKTHQFLHCSFSYVLIRINIGIIGKTKEECRADFYVASLSTKSEILTRDFCLFFCSGYMFNDPKRLQNEQNVSSIAKFAVYTKGFLYYYIFRYF